MVATQDDAEAERRLSQAKRQQPSAPAPPPKRQHFGPIESDDEDDDAAEVSMECLLSSLHRETALSLLAQAMRTGLSGMILFMFTNKKIVLN